MFNTEDSDSLATVLNFFQMPMFAVERVAPGAPFRLLCINDAHARISGMDSAAVRGRMISELLGAEDARHVLDRFGRCVATGTAMRYREKLELPTGVKEWDTTIQPVFTNDARERVIGTAIVISGQDARPSRAWEDVRFFSAQANFQLSQVATYLDAVAQNTKGASTAPGAVAAVSGICRSIERVLSDIRVLADRESPVGNAPPVVAATAARRPGSANDEDAPQPAPGDPATPASDTPRPVGLASGKEIPAGHDTDISASLQDLRQIVGTMR
ncbi:hypothetical protein EKE94_07125 [Mesobaculum littorinae]|uniref:PAS domain-containing protein n=1 Tax=Mesobaculum littorinae TaxID=2486419 RepID=A0A438AIU3_9RHOB|nr:hypothetical protein [Mesobaculum littorinae]RVV98673.1 hypothetical protein EKE94_07125 [Mesobaculum littorinae]